MTRLAFVGFIAVSFMLIEVYSKHVGIIIPGDRQGTASKRHRRDVAITEEEKKPEIYSLAITSSIAARFANTVVKSKIVNRASTSREALFTVQLPDSAFISNFSMEIDNSTYVGEVKEKQKAEKEYKKAKQRGQSAGHVSAKPRETNTFKVAINVAGGSKISFELTYQEMLQRRLSTYEHRISIRPGQIVKRLKIDVFITEPQGIEFLHVSPIVSNIVDTWNLGGSDETPVTINQESETRAHVSYYPTEDEQRAMSPEGIMGDLFVRYDVKHDTSAGEIQVLNGYFVHYFAPSNLPPVKKNVVFVIDVSGSMDGTKIEQTKEALRVILNDMRSFDRFNILTFSNDVSQWRDSTVLATPANVEAAKTYVSNLFPSGGTNFNLGLVEGAAMLQSLVNSTEDDERSASLIIMLTDGNPTSGQTNLATIQQNAKRAIDGQYSLFCLGFGNDVDFKFLQKIALENQGVGRRIYEDSDASLQLKGFYDEIATPLLFDVDIQYPSGNVEENTVTQSAFRNYFNGSEIVVAGKLVENNVANLVANVVANGADSELEFMGDFSPEETPASLLNRHVPEDFVQRLWAYLTIKELLRKRVLAEDPTVKESLSQEALQLSLRYNFVTPLTSMIVVKPEVPETNQAEGETSQEDGAADKDAGTPAPTSAPRPSRRKSKRKKSRGRARGGRRGGGRSYAYGDPHFVVDLEDGKNMLCFNINGEDGEILTLVSDPIKGLHVNARLIGDGNAKHGTYMGEVGIVIESEGNAHSIFLTAQYVAVGTSFTFPWQPMIQRFSNFALQIDADHTFTLTYDDNIVLVLHKVLRHLPTPDYFGFYVEDGSGFSKKVHGLIGQFYRKNMSIVNEQEDIFDPGYQEAELAIGDRRVEVFENYRKNEKTNQRVRCWFAHNNARGVIDGKRTSYIVHELFYRKFTPP
ncbi:inter-alpha-trypsin inhibitor heavy chain H3-like [Ptychodera flava]|uniref:inter-alpha-trypsin inhibitor heavy chain H3-like n=1 Tax=Ptychodera flava TaxID=63121 RepID=UPI00396A2FCF